MLKRSETIPIESPRLTIWSIVLELGIMLTLVPLQPRASSRANNGWY